MHMEINVKNVVPHFSPNELINPKSTINGDKPVLKNKTLVSIATKARKMIT